MIIEYYIYLSAIIFAISLTGMMLHQGNLILLLMCVELMLLAVNINLVAFSAKHAAIMGEIFVFFILTVAAAEAAVGLAIIVLLHRQRANITVETISDLKE